MFSVTDPAPFEVINRTGSAPLVIACDHASNRVPESLENLGLEQTELEKHIAYDIGAKQVAFALSEQFDAPLISANYSRLVIDLNRHLDDPSLIVDQSDGIAIPANLQLSETQRQWRIDEIFMSYHDAYSELVADRQSNHELPMILSIHSFTPSMNGSDRPWHYGVLWDSAHESLSKRILDNFQQFEDLTIGSNEPYHANDPKGYAQVIRAENNQLQMALIEIRQDIVADACGQNAAANKLFSVISPLLSSS